MWCHCWQSFWCAPYSHHQFILQNGKMLCNQNMKAKQRYGLRLFQTSSSIPLSSSPSSNTKKRSHLYSHCVLSWQCFQMQQLSCLLPFLSLFLYPSPHLSLAGTRMLLRQCAFAIVHTFYLGNPMLHRQTNAT